MGAMKKNLMFPALCLILIICTGCVLPATEASEYQSQSSLLEMPGTATLQASQTRLPTSTRLPSQSPQPASSPTRQVESTPTPFELASLSVSNEDRVTVLQDVSYPDGSILKPAALLIKTWRLENSGSIPWNNQYLIVHAYENTYSGPKVANLMFFPPDTKLGWNIGSWPEPLTEVLPGEIVDISILLQTPNKHGYQIGIWNLLTDQGERFSNPVWSQLQVNGTIPEDQLGWNGSWLMNDPFLEDSLVPITLALETSDQWTHGFFYNSYGQLVFISGSTQSDPSIMDGLYGKPNQRVGGTPLLLQLDTEKQVFNGTIWHDNQSQSSLCGARDEKSYMENCLPKETETNEPSTTPTLE